MPNLPDGGAHECGLAGSVVMKTRNNRGRWWLAACAIFGLLLLLGFGDREPGHEGRRLSDWLDDPALSEEEITRGVRAIGTNAIPQLQAWLIAQPGLFERTIRRVDRQIDYVGFGYHPSLDANFRARRGFLALGEVGAPAVPWLEEQARKADEDFEFYLEALLAAGPAGREGFNRLEELALRTNPEAYFRALHVGVKRSPELLPLLEKYLDHPEVELRRTAYRTTAYMLTACPPALRDALVSRMAVETNPELLAELEVWRRLLVGKATDEPGPDAP